MERTGFRSFSNVPLAGAVWAVLLLAVLVFIALDWSLLQTGIIALPLLVVALAVTVAARRNRQ